MAKFHESGRYAQQEILDMAMSGKQLHTFGKDVGERLCSWNVGQ